MAKWLGFKVGVVFHLAVHGCEVQRLYDPCPDAIGV